MLGGFRFKRKLLFTALVGAFFVFIQPVRADVIGQEQTFFVNPSHDQSERSQLAALLVAVSDYAYFYADKSYWSSLTAYQRELLSNQIDALALEFDRVIYPVETRFWGSEPNPGIDGDSRITILLEDLKNTSGGYFDTINLYPRSEAPASNVREMVAVNIEALPMLAKQFLAHEFQHLISFNQKELLRGVSEEVWLNELRSEYSPTLVRYSSIYQGSSLERRVNDFLEKPSDSITEWRNDQYDYGSVALLGHYLAEQYGSAILNATLQSQAVGITSFNNFLTDRGYQERFPELFRNWLIAVTLNDTKINPKYGYQQNSLQLVKIIPDNRVQVTTGASQYIYSSSLKPWQPGWYEFDFDLFDDSERSFALEFDSDSSPRFAAASVAWYNQGGPEVSFINVRDGKGQTYVINEPQKGKKVKKIIVAVANTSKDSGFSNNESSDPFSVKLSLVQTATAKETLALLQPVIADGALIKKAGSQEIYVVSGRYKRYLSPEAIKLYNHLLNAPVVTVNEQTFSSYQTSNYIRGVNDKKVYAVWPDDTKHWLNMSGGYFVQSGRSFDAVFIVSDAELNFYKKGVDIRR